jgi:6-phosphogluconolactonase
MGETPGPHIVLLGIGDDAHTASLFPGTDALDHDGNAYVANWVESKNVWRLTATIPMLHAADHLIFLVSGSEKAAALAEILEGELPVPAKMVADGANKVTWLIDEAAAMHLKTTKLTRLFI